MERNMFGGQHKMWCTLFPKFAARSNELWCERSMMRHILTADSFKTDIDAYEQLVEFFHLKRTYLKYYAPIKKQENRYYAKPNSHYIIQTSKNNPAYNEDI